MEKSTLTFVKLALLLSILFLHGCAARMSLCPDIEESRPYSKFSMLNMPGSFAKNIKYCEVPPVALEIYRENIFGNVWTRPEAYFRDLKSPGKNIRFLAIGDSWFAYPKKYWLFDVISPPSNILTNLGDLEFEGHKPRILSLSNGGEIVTNMAGIADDDYHDLPQRMQTDYRIPWVITRALQSASKQNIPFNYVLISGGGNDFYPDRIRRILLKEPDTSQPIPYKYINQDALENFIERIGAAYEALINHIRSHPGYENIKIITHTYDRITPMPIGAEVAGGLFLIGKHGWIYPVLEEYNITDLDHQRKIIALVLEGMKKKLESIASNENYKRNFLVVNTQGVLERAHECENPGTPFPVEDYWANEIHPTDKGFKYITQEIHRAIIDEEKIIDKKAAIGYSDCPR